MTHPLRFVTKAEAIKALAAREGLEAVVAPVVGDPVQRPAGRAAAVEAGNAAGPGRLVGQQAGGHILDAGRRGAHLVHGIVMAHQHRAVR